MKEYLFISFTANPPSHVVLRRMLADLDIQKSNVEELTILGSNYYVRMRGTDPRLGDFVAALNKLPFDPPWHRRVEVEYEQGDLEPCEFVKINVDRAPKGDTGPMYGTEYDLSMGCPECGTGALQISPLRINASSLPKKARVMRTYHGEVLIDNDLATDLMIGLHGERGLRQVEDRRKLEPLPWYQILPDSYMPPAEPSSELSVVREQCPRCKRDGFGFRGDRWTVELVYAMSEGERQVLPDFVYTWEHFGTSRIKWEPGFMIGFASAAVLVSNRVMKLFWKQRIRGVSFTPVHFV